MLRMLSIVGTMNTGGTETFLMKFYRTLDRTKYQIDFAIMAKGKNFYEDEIRSLGGNVFKITPKTESISKNYYEVKRLVQKYKYKIVMRSGENSANFLELFAAKRAGAKKLIFNCTNSKTGNDTFKEKFVNAIFMPFVRKISNVKIGCSASAVKFMFGKKAYSTGKAIVFHNGLKISEYSFNKERREKLRNELNLLESDVVYGNIGRFAKQKNHVFLIKIFKEILKKQPNAKLLLVGTGPLQNDIESMIDDSVSLKKAIIMGGVRSDIPDCLSAIDELIFPSLYEGLPNAVVEAQAAGLPCIVSDTITKEIKLTDNLFFKSLNEDPTSWANLCISKAGKRNLTAYSDLEAAGYDIEDVSKRLEKIIFLS